MIAEAPVNSPQPSDDWYSGPVSEHVWGDSGPWVRHVALAWQAVADPDGPHPFPPSPRAPFQDHGEVIAWWSPLFHLVFFGLGWPRPDVGLARWLNAGRPTDDPILRVIDQWWGDDVKDAVAWACHTPVFPNFCQTLAGSVGTRVTSTPLRDLYAERRRDPDWGQVWGGGGDSMHISHFMMDAWNGPVADPPGSLFHEGNPSRVMILLLPRYGGWYSALAAHGATLPNRDDGRSWQVKVVIEPLGVLGTFRRSRATGRWFSGRHRVHELGVGPAPGLLP